MSIEVRGVSKNFGQFAALRDIDLTVPDGELVALLGPSGSGKTTLLRLLAGLESPDSGQVLFNDHDITRRHPRERNVGFVFQHYALFGHMSVFENIAFGLRVRRVKNEEVQKRVGELMRLIQLEGLEKRYPSQLSGGQRQRVALARSLASRPAVLLLDEPFGALDAKVRQDLRRWLRGLHDEIHTTSVFVTHDQEEAFEVADRVVIVNKGRIEQAGTPDEVFSHPANEFVIDFLGRVNIFHGRVENGRALAGGFEVSHPESADHGPRAATVYVRAHEWELARERRDLNGGAGQAVRTRVARINRTGATVKLDLVPEDPSDATRTPFDAEVDDRRFAELNLQPNEIVWAAPRAARVFLGEGQKVEGGRWKVEG